jgi:hypothetical protein
LKILYSQGGLENIALSRKYYAFALNIMETSTRAIWGLYQCCRVLEKNKKANNDENSELLQMCKERLTKAYEKSPVSLKLS